EAARLGINRTAHAGESAGPASVVTAVEVMKVSRIGHGYRLLLDEQAYAKYALPGLIHFEGCPYSSVMTGAVAPDWTVHPMVRWANDNINFSISTDDPTCFDNCMNTEIELASLQIGLSLDQIKKCQLNAAKAAFLPEKEKYELVNLIQQAISSEKKN
uniref:Adenosine deaminase n=1 Tax=Ditylenchus dipsaci TaxID=166011 RepID=A0A915EIN1_9BILA